MCAAKYHIHIYIYVKVRERAHIMVRGSPRARQGARMCAHSSARKCARCGACTRGSPYCIPS